MVNVYGFNGQLTQERISQWSRIQSGLDFTCTAEPDWQARAVSGQDRTVEVTKGTGWGYGITIELLATESVQLASVASGVRHDLIAWELTWKSDGTGGSAKLVAIPGSSVQAMPTLAQTPGKGVAYVPIALARVQAGVQAPTIMEDYRVWGSQDLYCKTLAAVLNPRHGQKVTIADGTTWRRNGTLWERVYEKNLFWAGVANNNNGLTVGGQWIYPHWSTSTAWGAATLPVAADARISLPAGAYSCFAWANTTDTGCVAAISVDSATSLTTLRSTPAPGVHLNLANGSSGPLILPNATNIVVGFRMAGAFATNATQVKLLRVGDL